MIGYSYVLSEKYKGCEWAMRGDSYDGIEWLEDSPKPTKEALDMAYTQLMQEKEALQYKKYREAAYEARGADALSVIEALREYIAENRPEKLLAIQETVEQIKLEFPKPDNN